VEKAYEVARLHPKLSPGLLAVKITDEEDFSISESTGCRILRESGLIYPRLLAEMPVPVQKQWRHQSTGPEELWHFDATNLFVIGWGYYKHIPVEDEFPRKIIARDVRPDEAAFSLWDTLEMGLENARKEGDLTGNDPMPKLYSDDGSGFASKLLAEYPSQHGIKHIFGTPYHPQGGED
jgi:transposase InsO family protein